MIDKNLGETAVQKVGNFRKGRADDKVLVPDFIRQRFEKRRIHIVEVACKYLVDNKTVGCSFSAYRFDQCIFNHEAVRLMEVVYRYINFAGWCKRALHGRQC